MKWLWLAAVVVLLALPTISCRGGSEPAETDKVVGVLLKCTVPPQTEREYDYDGNGSSYVVPAREFSGDMCEQLLDRAPDRERGVSALNALYVVTVRTSTGSSYTVEVPAMTRVTVGEIWPPTN